MCFRADPDLEGGAAKICPENLRTICLLERKKGHPLFIICRNAIFTEVIDSEWKILDS
jgi:hypothetical protein